MDCLSDKLLGILRGILGNKVDIDEGARILERLMKIPDIECRFEPSLNSDSIMPPNGTIKEACKVKDFINLVAKVAYSTPEEVIDSLHNNELYDRVMEIENSEEVSTDFGQQIKMTCDLFEFYFTICVKYRAEITEYYNLKKSDSGNYVEYAKAMLEKFKDTWIFKNYEENFIQYGWNNIKNSDQKLENINASIKLIGEPGSGKTMQMIHMYRSCLESAESGELKKYPVWISMASLADTDLQEQISNLLKRFFNESSFDYAKLFEMNQLILFLDGFDELRDKREETAIRLNNIHKNNSNLIMIISDRMVKSIPSCLVSNIDVYKFDGMSPEERKEYIKKYVNDDEKKINILKYLDEATWMTNMSIVPEMMNYLKDSYPDSCNTANNKDGFYYGYLLHMLERQSDDKYDSSNVETLKSLLRKLARSEKVESDLVKFSAADIEEVWINLVVGGVKEVNFYRDKAVDYGIFLREKNGSGDDIYRFRYKGYYSYFRK